MFQTIAVPMDYLFPNPSDSDTKGSEINKPSNDSGENVVYIYLAQLGRLET
jgi:hypothetical protein